jgi:biopolymer transport protein ExbB
MTAYRVWVGEARLRRAVIAAFSIASLCLATLILASGPGVAEDAAGVKPQTTAAPAPGTSTNTDAAKAQSNAQTATPAPNPAPVPNSLKPNDDSAAKPQPTSLAPAPVPGAANNANNNDAAKLEHEPSANVPARILPRELSPWGMFLNADVIVKVVMVGLAIASVITWTVWLAKSFELFGARRRVQEQLKILAQEETLATTQAGFTGAKGPVAQMVAAAAAELERSAALSPEGIKERAAALIARIEARAGREMNRGTGILATIGATAPFIGLFGTVWGIMNSFIGISKTNTTNLAVVAPGIAEALLATAIGLVAAIPAVIIYNAFARGIASYRASLGDAATEILRHLSRDLDRAVMEAAEDDEDWRVVGMRQSAE